jgi:hypothetical protein
MKKVFAFIFDAIFLAIVKDKKPSRMAVENDGNNFPSSPWPNASNGHRRHDAIQRIQRF